MAAVYHLGSLDVLYRTRADRVAVMRRQLPRILSTLHGLEVKSGADGGMAALESEGRSLLAKLKKRMGM